MEKCIQEFIWQKVKDQIDKILEDNSDYFVFNTNSEYIFMQKFEEYLSFIKLNFMHDDVKTLDRHKIAAIIICSIIEANPLRMKFECEENQLFDGNEKIAVNIGLSYMKSVLILLLNTTDEKGKFEEFAFPKALACETDYITIFCRNLFYAKKYYALNPLEIANTLFLLENFSLEKYNIDSDVIRKKYEELEKK